jgi:AcrR family transcriptional regulator
MPRPDPKDAEPTPERLRAAAMAEFNEHGFAGTDTNRIARRAGFAPQTFYRWYKDKTEIFVAAYRAWWDEEKDALQALLASDAPSQALADAGVAHHRRHLMFRRSLNQLSIENAEVRQARAENRLRQVGEIRAWTGRADLPAETIAVMLFQFERLADAAAEGELADMGLSDDAAKAEIARLIGVLRG